MARLTLKLHVTERDALFKMAEQERRDPRDQAALIIRAELERRGLLPVNRLPVCTPTDAAQGQEVCNATAG